MNEAAEMSDSPVPRAETKEKRSVSTYSPGDTRERILAAGQHFFAEQGFEGATLRDITDAARVNLAAVNYHFGSKDELLRQVLETGIAPIVAARMAALDDCLARHGTVPPLDAMVEALVRPLVALSSGDHRDIMRILMHVRTAKNSWIGDLVADRFKPLHERFVDVLQRILPDLSRSEVAFRYDGGRSATLQILVDLAPAARLVGGLDTAAQPDQELLVRRLISFITAGFRAPATR